MIKRLGLSLICGVFAGFSAAIFLISLEWATVTRNKYPFVIWGLPLAGLLIGWVYSRFGREMQRGNNLILDEIHDPTKKIPILMAPFILAGTLLTHFFGGSAGREGTAVQMGASLADQVANFFKVRSEERKILLMAGAGAGFGAAIGAPWAGFIFGMEVIQIGRLRLFAWLECLIASFAAYYVAVYLGSPHSHYPRFSVPELSLKSLFFIALAGVIFGVAANLFVYLTHALEKIFSKGIRYLPLQTFSGGLLLVLFYFFEGSYKYVGLGIPAIQSALLEPATFEEPLFKGLFTALTLASGFKGGEFIPLVFIGTTLGSALALIFPISFQLLGAVGFAAVFGAAANTPIACAVMAIEIFGLPIAPYALLGCFVSYTFAGPRGIYKSQRIVSKRGKIWGWF